MKKQNFRPFPVFIIGFWCLMAILWVFVGGKNKELPEIELSAHSEEIAEKENVQSRREYEMQRLANPATGLVPAGIRNKEVAYAKNDYFNQLASPAGQAAGIENTDEALTWSAAGPENFGGRTRALALDVGNENILLAGAVSGGVWKSLDQGKSWRRTTSINQLQSVTAIVQDTRPGKEHTWYYGTGELVGNSARVLGAPFRGDGLFKSTDGGDSWQPLNSTQSNNPGSFDFPFNYVWDLVTDPKSDDDVIIAAIFGGIVRSADGGQTWKTVLGDDLLGQKEVNLNKIPAPFYTDVHRTTDGTFYATLSSATNQNNQLFPDAGFYRSDDGISWIRIFGPLQGAYRRTEIGSSPGNPNVVYFISDTRTRQGYIARRYDRNPGRITVLTGLPSGDKNEREEFDSQKSYNLFVRVHPTDENLVFLGGTNLYRHTNGLSGATGLAWIGGYDPDKKDFRIYPNHHPDQHDLLFLPSNPKVAFSANDGGIFRTDDITAKKVTYTSLNNGYVTTQYYTGYVPRSPKDDFVFGGLQDNGSIVTQGKFKKNNSKRILSGDGAFGASTRFGIYYYMSFQRAKVLRLTWNNDFKLTSFAGIRPVGAGTDPAQPFLFVNPYKLDPNNGNRMYFAGGDFLWRNRNLSQIPSGSQEPTALNWAKLARTEITEGVISAVEVSARPANVVFYGTTLGQLFRIENAHNDGYAVSEITAANFPAKANVSAIAVNPVDANEVLVTFSNYGIRSVFHSANGGKSFTDVSGNLEENADGSGNGPSVRWGVIVPKVNGRAAYFLATSTGLYSTASLKGTPAWEIEGVNTIGNSIVNMVNFRRSDGKIVAATHGNGLFVSQVPDVAPLAELTSGNKALTIEPPFPNPFRDEVTLRFKVPETDFALIRVYSASGQLIRVLSAGLGFAGENEVFWDGNNSIGQPVPDGVYLIRFNYKRTHQARKILLSRK